MPPALGPLLRQLLADRGGVAGRSALAGDLSQALGRGVSPRRVRDIARSAPTRVTDLGAGYLALTEQAPEPVESFARRVVAGAGGSMAVEPLVERVLEAYPHGDARSVRAWLAQDPGSLQREGDRVRWLGSRRR